ncbi:MAG: TonB-dependent receptor [Acidobacteriia bacterium]|nr:TonB-dependent receptor [Terriglobia bacterium]
MAVMRFTILLFAAVAGCWGAIRVRVLDTQGNSIPSARIEVLSSAGNVVHSGMNTVPDAPPGALLRVSAPGFGSALVVSGPEVAVTLEPVRVSTQITVSATPGIAEDIMVRPELVLSGDPGSGPTVAHALESRPNVLLQQTGAGQVSSFLRGLTGYQVLNLVDGVRFNNSTFRSGPNQYLAFMEPGQAAEVEAMLGPSGTQYGSDGLGGTIQVITDRPRFDATTWHGNLSLFGQTADLSGGLRASISHSAPRLWFLAGAAGQRHNDLRTGGGLDSHNVLTRLYGLTPQVASGYLGKRLRDTAYSQGGAHGKLAVRPDDRQSLTAWYQRGEVHGLRNTKDLWGGLGRLQAALRPQILDLFYVRYERLRLAGFDSLSGRFSVNRQQDGGTRQGLRASDAVTSEYSSVQSLGYAGQGVTHVQSHTVISLGGELYDEQVRSDRLTNGVRVRPLYPDNSNYRTGGMYGQAATEYRRLRASYGVRYSHIGYANPENPVWRMPATSQAFHDWTWQASLLARLAPTFALHGLVSRGFRAPNLNDLGAIGLNDLGYEIPAREAIPAKALLADSSGEGALSKGLNLRPLQVERLRNVEFGLRFQARRHRARVQFFDALLSDPIARRTLLFAAGAVPTQLAGFNVTPIPPTAAQRAQGVVTVAGPIDPRALKAFVNDGQSRYWGVEADWEFRMTSRWLWSSSYSWLMGRDLDPNRNIRRLPPQNGATRLRYIRARFWSEVQLFASGAQTRLSGGDRDDERIGASRRRQDIADFFASARAAEVRTGETLRMIQDRVLPGVADTVRVTLFNETPGWVTVDLRAGLPISETLSIEAALTNLADRNYRVHGSGIDSPGRSVRVQLNWRF